MNNAAEAMKGKINNTKFENPSFNIIGNVTGQVSENNSNNIKELLIKQIFSTVKWRKV